MNKTLTSAYLNTLEGLAIAAEGIRNAFDMLDPAHNEREKIIVKTLEAVESAIQIAAENDFSDNLEEQPREIIVDDIADAIIERITDDILNA